jgi:superfamily I DNA/RNA helicase
VAITKRASSSSIYAIKKSLTPSLGGQSFFDKAEIKDIVSYLRLIANEDDDPAFIRAATTPKKGIGNTTLERLGEYASAHHLSLFAAAFEGDFQREIGSKQLDDLLTFCQYINKLQSRAVRDPAGEVLADLLECHSVRKLFIRQRRASRRREQMGQRARVYCLAHQKRRVFIPNLAMKQKAKPY